MAYDLTTGTVDRIHIRNAAVDADEAVRKGEMDTGLAAKSASDHTHAQLHDAVTIAAGLQTTTTTVAGQELSVEVKLAAGSALVAAADGLKADVGTGATQVAAGNHTHANDHAAATAGTNTNTAAVTVTDQVITVDVRLKANGGLASDADGTYADVGTGAAQVAAGNHTHAAVTAEANGLMTPAMLSTLNAAGAAVAVTVADTDTVDLTLSAGNQLTASVRCGAGLQSTASGVAIDPTAIPQLVHDHKVVYGVDAVTITNPGTGYTSVPTVAFTGDGSDAAGTAWLKAIAAAIAGGGTGYTANDVLTVSGGTSTTTAKITASAVDGSGVITSISLSTAGNYSVLPSNAVAVTGGTGTGATFNLTWGVGGVDITNKGHNYPSATVGFSGGGGTGAAGTVSIWTDPGFVAPADVDTIATHETRLDAHDTSIATIEQELTGNIVPYGVSYTAGTYAVTVVQDNIYHYIPGANETSLNNGGTVITVDSVFTAASALVTLYSAGGGTVTAQIIDVTAVTNAANAVSEVIAKCPLPKDSLSIGWTWGDLVTAGVTIFDLGVAYAPQDIVYEKTTKKYYCAVQAAIGFAITNQAYWAEAKAGYDAANWVDQDYTVGQQVRYSDGNDYQCILNTTAHQIPTNTTYWGELVTFAPSRADVTLVTDGGLTETNDGLRTAVLVAGAGAIAFQGADTLPTSDATLKFNATAKAITVDGYVSLSEQAVNLTANNQVVTPTKNIVTLSSDSTTATDRVFKVAAPPATGWHLTINWSGTNAGKLTNNSTQGGCAARLDNDWLPEQYSSISLYYNGTDWIEKGRQGAPPNDLASISANGVVVRTAANTYTSRQITSVDESLVITNPTGTAGDIDIKLAPCGLETVTYAASVAIDMNGEPMQVMSPTGNLTLSTTNRGGGKQVSLYLHGDTVDHTISFAAGIVSIGDLPTVIPASKLLAVSFTSLGANETDTVVAYGVQP